MRTTYILLYFLFAGHLACAQNFDWFANNPKWEVLFTAGFAGAGLETVTVARDTSLGGRTAKVMHRPNFGYTRMSVAAQSGDSIFLWNDMESQYYLLYDMSAPVGTVFKQRHWYHSGLIQYEVVDTGTLQIGTENLRVQKWANAQLSAEYFVIEGIGMVYLLTQGGQVYPKHFFWNEPDNSASDGEAWALCTFSNDLISYDPTPNVDECFGLVAAPDLEADRFEVTIAPNPAQDFMRIERTGTGSTAFQVSLFDMLGKQMMRSPFVKNSYVLERGDMESGLYFYRVQDAQGRMIQSGKVIFVE